MKVIEARDRIAVAEGLSQGVLPLYEQEVANRLNTEKKEFLGQLMTNVDGDVHAFTDKMPGVLAGMLTARSSRSPESDITEVLWQEFLQDPDLVVGNLNGQSFGNENLDELLNLEKSSGMARRILERFGDDSVREDASAYLAVQNRSVLTSMELFWHPLVTGIEMSTRYVDWREKDNDGHYHYVVPETIVGTSVEGVYREAMDGLFETYIELWDPVWEYFEQQNPRQEGVSDAAYETAIRGAVCDTLRKLLPLGIKTNFVVHAHYRTLSEVVMNMRASKSKESQSLGDDMTTELLSVNPAFIEMVNGPYGQRSVQNLQEQRGVIESVVPRFISDGEVEARVGVNILNGDYLGDLIRATIAAENPNLTNDEIESLMFSAAARLEDGWAQELAKLLEETRGNRRHKPDELLQVIALEVSYEGISFSGYKDLNRHRNIMFKTEPDWSGQLGYYVPDAILKIGGEVERRYREAQEIAAESTRWFSDLGLTEEAKLLLTHGLKTNFRITMGLQQSIWIEELRSIASGDPEYRWFAQEQKRQRDLAMPELSALGGFVDFNDYPLGRIREAVRADLKGKK